MSSRILVLMTVVLSTSFSGMTANAGFAYNANNAFRNYELANAGNVSPNFGNFSAGYNEVLGGFTPFTDAEHTDNWFDPNLQGWKVSSVYSVPAVVVNTSNTPVFGVLNPGSIAPAEIILHGGGSDFDGSGTNINAVLRFTSTIAGEYAITGSWQSLDSGLTINYVLKNSSTLFSSSAANSNFNLTTTLGVGETIDFVVNNNNDGFGFDSTGLFAQITAVPEPTMLALFGVGGVGMFGLAKRRRKTNRAV